MNNSAIQLPRLWPVSCHTDFIGQNSTFVAIKGQKEDGITYASLALKKGAKTIIASYDAHITPDLCQTIKDAQAELIFVKNPRRTLALLSAQSWFYPAKKLKIIAITGTKGKTTTAWLLYHILQSSGKKAALLSTVENKIDTASFPASLTTPHPDYLHAFFHTCVNAEIEYVVVETAAQAATLQRTVGLEFDGLIFTNFAPAHGEFYQSVDDYFAAKRALCDQIKPDGFFLINGDDQALASLPNQIQMAQSFSINKKSADFFCQRYTSTRDGITARISSSAVSINISCPALIGEFNLYNIIAACSAASRIGILPMNIEASLKSFEGVPGRLEKYILANKSLCFIDYAHNPLAFQSVLPFLRSLTNHLIVVSGAGGNRDRSMRPQMGKLLSEFADIVILTSDNPRAEDPVSIIHDIAQGIPDSKKDAVIYEVDRKIALEIAYKKAKSNSIIALLGKGPEQYQIVGDQKIPFSERTIIQSFKTEGE